MSNTIRIGTRDSQLAVWQATLVKDLLANKGVEAELVFMKSEGDLDLITPLYALGVQGVFTKTLDAALLNNRIDIAVHSMKDVPITLAQGIKQAAVLERASDLDILVYKDESLPEQLGYVDRTWTGNCSFKPCKIGTGSVRRVAQWLNRYQHHSTENLRGNVNTRLRKLEESDWDGAIFAAAGLERIGLRPEKSLNLDWMLCAPAQGAIMIVCREDDQRSHEACAQLNHEATAIATQVERDFLEALMGGCSTPISGYARVEQDQVRFRGNVVSPDGRHRADVSLHCGLADHLQLGKDAADKILADGGSAVMQLVRKKEGGLA